MREPNWRGEVLRIDNALLLDEEEVRFRGRLPPPGDFLRERFGNPEAVLGVRPPPLPPSPFGGRWGEEDVEDVPAEGVEAFMKGAGLALAQLGIQAWILGAGILRWVSRPIRRTLRRAWDEFVRWTDYPPF